MRIVRDMMSRPPITVRETTMVRDALERMHEADIRHVPIVDGRDRLLGVLSERDAFRAFLRSRDLLVPVGAVMSQDVLTVRAETRTSEATALMLDHKIGCLPVVDEQMRVVGIITETDFLRVAHNALGGDSLADPSRSGSM